MNLMGGYNGVNGHHTYRKEWKAGDKMAALEFEMNK
jgi:hypothetical protein